MALLAMVIFVAIAGLRLDTGYDWIAYEAALEEAPPLINLSFGDLPPLIGNMEPLFVILLCAIKEFGGSIQILFFVLALFNGLVFYCFVRYCKGCVILAFAVYFCWAYLSAQMGIIRQSIAISFLMLSLIQFDKSKYSAAAVLLLITAGFQYTVLMFAPIFLTRFYRQIIAVRLPLIILMLGFYFLGYNLFDALTKILGIIGPSFIESRVTYYANLGASPKSIGSMAYLILNAFTFLYFSKITNPQSTIEKSLMLSILMMISIQALFWQFPLLWNRAQFFAVIAQSILLYKTWPAISRSHKVVQLFVVFILSIAALIKPLMGDGAQPYLPYQSILRFLYSDDPGDGRKRLEYYNYQVERGMF